MCLRNTPVSILIRFMFNPTHTRCGYSASVSVVKHWISNNKLRLPLRIQVIAEPGEAVDEPDKKISLGLSTLSIPRSVILKIPTVSISPKRFLLARRVRTWPSLVSICSNASTICTKVCGPAISLFLLTCAMINIVTSFCLQYCVNA